MRYFQLPKSILDRAYNFYPAEFYIKQTRTTLLTFDFF